MSVNWVCYNKILIVKCLKLFVNYAVNFKRKYGIRTSDELQNITY